jgi:hypothetical protein
MRLSISSIESQLVISRGKVFTFTSGHLNKNIPGFAFPYLHITFLSLFVKSLETFSKMVYPNLGGTHVSRYASSLPRLQRIPHVTRTQRGVSTTSAQHHGENADSSQTTATITRAHASMAVGDDESLHLGELRFESFNVPPPLRPEDILNTPDPSFGANALRSPQKLLGAQFQAVDAFFDRDGHPSFGSNTGDVGCDLDGDIEMADAECTPPQDISFNSPEPSTSPKLLSRTFDFLEALSYHADEALLIAEYLDPDDIVNLYSISKHYRNTVTNDVKRLSSLLIKNHSRFAAKAFPAPGGGLSITMVRRPFPTANPSIPGNIYMPNFRYINMVVYRHRICESVLRKLYAQDVHFPDYMLCVMQKMWFTMNFPLNSHRRTVLGDKSYWTDGDLRHALLFMAKLDGYFSDVLTGNRAECILRRLCLAQKNMLLLFKIASKCLTR